jgi:hypothetical protein
MAASSSTIPRAIHALCVPQVIQHALICCMFSALAKAGRMLHVYLSSHRRAVAYV